MENSNYNECHKCGSFDTFVEGQTLVCNTCGWVDWDLNIKKRK